MYLYAHTYIHMCVCVCAHRNPVGGGKQKSFQSSCATTPLSWKLTHTSSDAFPPPTPCSAKKKKKKDEKRREREENPHQRCTPTGAGPAEHQVAGPSSISDMTWMKVHKVCDTGGGISAHVFVAALLQHHLPPCARCSATAIAGYIGYIYRERIHPYERTTLQRQEPIGGGYLLPARP